jgi:hypothetical protein
MKGWLLPISVTLGLAAAGAVTVWSVFDWPARERLQAEAPVVSVGTLPPSPGVRRTPETGSQMAIRGAGPQTPLPVPAPSNLDPLFTALAMQRPPEPPEAPDFTLPDLQGRPVQLRELPTTYLIDPEGRLIGTAVGGRDWSITEAKTLIAGLLKQASVTVGEPAPSPSAAGR